MSPDEACGQGAAELVVRSQVAPDLADDVRLQALWLSLQQRTWRSLAVLGASKGIPTLDTAHALARIAWAYTGQPSCVFDMRDLSLRLLEHQIRDMSAQLQGGERVFVALRSLSENPTASPLAMASDAVVLCVQLGKTDMKSAQKTITTIGRQRFLGTLMVSDEVAGSTALMRDDAGGERPEGMGGARP